MVHAGDINTLTNCRMDREKRESRRRRYYGRGADSLLCTTSALDEL